MTLCVALRAHAFNDLGHYVSAKLAYDQLTDAQRESVHRALKNHPHYAEYLAANVPPLSTEREWSFLRAAAWADWIRSHHRAEFNKSEWHYINYPYKLREPVPAVLPEPLEQPGGNILRQLALAKQVAIDPASADLGLGGAFTSDQQRALALTWLFHLTGDLHQPLHVVALIDDTRFPRETHGDQGGNKLAIVAQGTRPTRLHAFWDGALGSDPRYENVVKLAEVLWVLPVSLPELSSHATIESWAKESYELAVQEVYQNGNLQIAEWKPAYDRAGASAGPEVPVFSDAMKDSARAVSQRRLILAGRRLARQLAEIFP
jgi:hypothetical protein